MSVFPGIVHYAGGFSFSGIALTDTGGAQVRFFVGLPAMQLLLAPVNWSVKFLGSL